MMRCISMKFDCTALDIAEPQWPRRSPRMAKSQHLRRSQVLITRDREIEIQFVLQVRRKLKLEARLRL